MELAFAGLQQLCAPLMDHLDELPEPQREALNVAFGRGVGPTPDRFLVGLAVLSLMAAAADDQPLALHRRRRAMARPGVGADPRLRGAAPAGRTGRPGLRRPRQRRRGVGRAPGTGDQRPVRRRRTRPAGIGDGRGHRPAGARPHRRRDARRSAGHARGAAKRHRGRVGRRLLDLRAKRSSAAAIEDEFVRRIKSLPQPTQTVAARRGGRTGRRRRAVPARCGGVGHSGRRAGARRSRGGDRVRPAHALPPSVDALGRLPRRRTHRTPSDPSGVGRRHRSAVGS